jgi:hypothetical protein
MEGREPFDKSPVRSVELAEPAFDAADVTGNAQNLYYDVDDEGAEGEKGVNKFVHLQYAVSDRGGVGGYTYSLALMAPRDDAQVREKRCERQRWR